MVTDVPHMIRMWDFERNTESPDKTRAHSKKLISWKCPDCGYLWTVSPKTRFNSDKCPCHELNMVIRSGVNDVLTVVKGFADLLDGNNDFDVIASQGISSRMQVNFCCKKCGRKWRSRITTQVKRLGENNYCAVGCPHCDAIEHESVAAPYCTDIDAISKFWDANNILDPAQTRSDSREIVHFICKNCGFDWSDRIAQQAKQSGKCKCCETMQVIKKGISDIFTVIPNTEQYYDFNKNTGIDIDTLSFRDNKTLLDWKCPSCGNEWRATISACIQKKNAKYVFRGCGRCRNSNEKSKVTVATTSRLKDFWDYELNGDIDINITPAYDTRRAHWICKKCGYKWVCSIKGRYGSKYDCPSCYIQNLPPSSKATFVITGYTDAITLCPDLVSIYDFETNEQKGIDIYSLGAGSNVRAHFKCKKCGHEWDSSIHKRIDKSHTPYRLIDCPKCSNPVFRSIPYSEQFPDWVAMFREDLNAIPLDSIRGAEAIQNTKYKWDCLNCRNTFESTIDAMAHSYQKPTKGCPYCSSRKMCAGNSFAEIHPDLMDEYSTDNEEDPYANFPHSAKRVKWTCRNCGHIWFATFSTRHNGYGNCPVCNRSAVVKEVNSFAAVYPDLAQYWAQSNEKSSEEVFYNLYCRFNFICPTCGGEYNSWLNEFVSKDHHNCPYCRGTRALPGYNSLKTLYPEIAQRWSDGNDSDADSVLPSLSYEKLWVCGTCHGEYSAPIRDVVAGVDECPYCKGTRVLPGYNSLKALYPEAAKRWSSSNDTDPDQVLPSLSYEKLWVCGTCHGEYLAQIRDVVAGVDECPYCKGTKILPGYNSFADRHPDLISELDALANYLLPVSPNEVLDNSTYKFWWICKNDKSHKYYMSPKNRLMFEKRGREPCLYCRGQRRKLNHFVLDILDEKDRS